MFVEVDHINLCVPGIDHIKLCIPVIYNIIYIYLYIYIYVVRCQPIRGNKVINPIFFSNFWKCKSWNISDDSQKCGKCLPASQWLWADVLQFPIVTYGCMAAWQCDCCLSPMIASDHAFSVSVKVEAKIKFCLLCEDNVVFCCQISDWW